MVRENWLRALRKNAVATAIDELAGKYEKDMTCVEKIALVIGSEYLAGHFEGSLTSIIGGLF